ncbi:hypothetical protein A8D95_11065 [Burkholderia cenocepacia]|nr:hypothetical protein A8D88_25925 [Burkholderia cenocepacia]ONP78950.1 hypothetical protein A8D94_07035 [Burkholderia cenocepacia]ONQ33091.1 hypothetical protein A8D95_11065 [Burkholderia cenocepacia]ONQ79245.1 hypothetical protein A8E06_05490 [Burkholderia cenocepacia]ONQ83320.1 hypothetical protein A8E08_36935 [Burkholderia cenocepacia]
MTRLKLPEVGQATQDLVPFSNELQSSGYLAVKFAARWRLLESCFQERPRFCGILDSKIVFQNV